MFNRVIFSSESFEWNTPNFIFNELDKEFHFTLDVAADKTNSKCSCYYSIADDSLSSSWFGVCWCNPPYSRRIGDWVKKACESDATVVMLIPARTDTKWFHDYVVPFGEVRFIRGRLYFGDSKNPAPFPSMIVIFRNSRFVER